ncbi:MAG: hypothetical protein JOZ72_07770 [Alphaproteobacteria bacterium]|nr:hypothetical protein [Alphaproteobacteria bacterium]
MGAYSYAYGLNKHGESPGHHRDSHGAWHGFLRKAGGKTKSFEISGSTFVAAYGMNHDGAVSGFYRDHADVTFAFVRAPDGTIAPSTRLAPTPATRAAICGRAGV